jgi:hypothetical protein
MIRRLLRIVFYLALLALVLAVAGLLLLDTILKAVVENRIRAETGMDAEIGKLNVGLLTPTITIKDFKLNNSADFGGAPFLVIREARVEYDRAALKRGKLHLPLLRLDFQEIDEVIDERGRSSFEEIHQREEASARKKAANHEPELAFGGIDHLNLTLSKGRTIHLGHPDQNQEVIFGLDNQVFSRVNSDDDLDTLMIYLSLRTGGAMRLQGLVGRPPPGKASSRPAPPKRP